MQSQVMKGTVRAQPPAPVAAASRAHQTVGQARQESSRGGLLLKGRGWKRRVQILHRVYRDKVLLCGRPRTKAYEVVEDITRMGNLVCKTCERNAS